MLVFCSEIVIIHSHITAHVKTNICIIQKVTFLQVWLVQLSSFTTQKNLTSVFHYFLLKEFIIFEKAPVFSDSLCYRFMRH